jgi:hypothetical protein
MSGPFSANSVYKFPNKAITVFHKACQLADTDTQIKVYLAIRYKGKLIAYNLDENCLFGPPWPKVCL